MEQQGVCSGDTARYPAHLGLQIVDDVQIPETLTPGHYVLQWRWDCDGSQQASRQAVMALSYGASQMQSESVINRSNAEVAMGTAARRSSLVINTFYVLFLGVAMAPNECTCIAGLDELRRH